MQCQVVDSNSKNQLIAFLKRHEEYPLFLLSNLEQYGLELSTAPYSGNYKILLDQGKVLAAFCLTRSGTLLVQSISKLQDIFHSILTACLQEPIPISGLLGEWNFCYMLWEFLKAKGIIKVEGLTSKEILYTLIPAEMAYDPQPAVRLLTPEDFEEWLPLRLNYIDEMGVPSHQRQEICNEFMEKTGKQISWGLFFQKQLVSIADLNAFTGDLGQVGGVYTIPTFRKRGFCTQIMKQLILDCHHLHHIRKLIIFTGEKNISARKVYESLGVQPYGHIALLFGE